MEFVFALISENLNYKLLTQKQTDFSIHVIYFVFVLILGATSNFQIFVVTDESPDDAVVWSEGGSSATGGSHRLSLSPAGPLANQFGSELMCKPGQNHNCDD